MAGYLLFHRRARRTLLSRLGAEPSRTARGTANRSGDRIGALWTVAFQQALGALQLALRLARQHRWDFLRPSMARTTSRAGFEHYPCQRRLAMGPLVLGPRGLPGRLP